jgi:hypothetical protein
MSINPDDSVWQSFLSATNNYIDLIDKSGQGDLVETCADLHESLLELQLAALDLPQTTLDSADPAMVTEAKRADRAKLAATFSFSYQMSEQVLSTPTVDPPEIRNVSDDLADIYESLQDILALNEQRYLDDAVWQARGGYVEDWGYLVVSVQTAFWKYIAEATIEAEEAVEPEG